MNVGKRLTAALAAFLVFAPVTFVWHTVLFSSFYLGPNLSVKSADAFDPRWIVGANALLVLGMAFILPALLPEKGRLKAGAILGALFASLLIEYHNFTLIGLFPGQDPASLYLMDALWGLIDGALAGVVVTAVHDRLERPAPAPAALASRTA